MIPFDADALLVVLLAFYQPATPENLARALRERPEYFAGGVLIGHSGDAMRLPDGRVFDLIFSVGGVDARYQVLYKPPTSDAGADPFPLEDGPLAPIDPATFVVPMPRVNFTDLVGQAFDELPGQHARLEDAQRTIVEHSVATRIEAASALYLEPADAAHAEHARTFGSADPSDLLAVSGSHAGIINTNDHAYDDPAPPEAPPPDVPENPNRPGDGPPPI